MELWNKRDLAPPVMFNFKCKTKNCRDEILAFTAAITSALQYFESLHSFEKAAAYVSRFTVRWNNRFYNMHGFRLLKRLKQSLLRFRSVDIARILSNLDSMLPDASYLGKTVEMPTRANLDYLLVRLQGLGKLFCRIVVLTKEATKYYVRFISTCYFFNISSMFLCLLAEVWYKSRDICRRIVKLYNQILPFRSFLENAGNEWPAQDECSFPNDLGTWLGTDWTHEILIQDDSSEGLNLRPDTNLFVLLTAEEEDLSSTKKVDALIDKKIANVEAESNASIPKARLMQRIKTDIGECVTRGPPASKSNHFDLKCIRSKFDAKKMLLDEKQKRKENLTQALSKNVDDSIFNAFASSMMREINKMSSGDYVNMFKEELMVLINRKKGKSKK